MVRKTKLIFITNVSGISLALACSSLESIKTLDPRQVHKSLTWPITGLSSKMHILGLLPNVLRCKIQIKVADKI